ncbi:helix-turn-helix domain-containing protein [Streptomyces chrestomyceticus]|uniref:helix-turn-helix domain-containing protein n=1 Tax=Streptomyces chrestomyceticus TaxID=68185 RepID=UPI0033C400FD
MLRTVNGVQRRVGTRSACTLPGPARRMRMDTQGIGRRVAYWRERRRLTQANFGALMGQSRRWVQDFEAGQRQANPKISIVHRATAVLQVPLLTL